MSLIILSILICIIENYVVAVTYGPSLVSLTKYNKQVHGPTLFHPETGRLLNLKDYPNYSVIVPLVPDSPSATSNQVFISRRVSGPGEFIVEAPEGHGVMAVIQSMDLRTADPGCNDFIQFGELGDDDGLIETPSICGKVDNRDGNYVPSELIGPRSFLSSSGKMRVLFYHGYIWGLVRDFNFDLLDPSRNPVLKVEIVFTAYKECDPLNSNSNGYRSCSNSPYRKTCISSNLFCDRIVNCAFEEGFGSDEYISNCFPQLFNLLMPFRPTTIPIKLPVASVTSTKINPITFRTFTTTTATPSRSSVKTVASTTPTNVTSTTTATKRFEQSISETHTTSTTKKPASLSTTTTATTSTSTTNAPLKTTSKNSEVEVRKNINLHKSNEPQNMTFNEGNDLSVDLEEAKLELLQDEFRIEDNLEESSTGLLIGIIGLIAVIIIILVGLRIYCCYHTVIWVPNPKSLRRKRKEAEASVFDNQESPEDDKNAKRKGSTKTAKETPPSYDILFPAPGEKEEV